LRPAAACGDGIAQRSAAVSTSRSVRRKATLLPAKFANVSVSACSLDQRTLANGRCGRRGPIATSQYPPSLAGPNAARARPSAVKAAATSSESACGISQPTMATRPRGKRRTARCIRAPRSPLPWPIRATPAGIRNRVRSGVTASMVRNRRSAASRRNSRVNVVVWKHNAARSPMSRASRRLTAPSRGARANTMTVSSISTAARSPAVVCPRNTMPSRPDCAPIPTASRLFPIWPPR